MNNRQSECGLCLEYAGGECSSEEKLAFEAHLPGCPECRSEVRRLRLVWGALPAVKELVEPPAELKRQVMEAVLDTEARLGGAYTSKSGRKFPWWKFAAALAASAVIFLSGFIGSELLRPDQNAVPIPLEEAWLAQSSRIEQLIPLKPFGPGAEYSAYGYSCVVDNGSSKQFVLYVFGVQANLDNQAYQVWLVEDGARRSAGTFRVDDRGIGVMAMPIASGSLRIDRIDITLEPDDRGQQPRGELVFSSS